MTRPAIHPGEILADELNEVGTSPTELARQIDVPPNRISQIINGKRAVTGDTALRLAHWFGTSPEFWLNLHMAYELRLAEQEAFPFFPATWRKAAWAVIPARPALPTLAIAPWRC